MTHGMCRTCSEAFFARPSESLVEFLDRLGAPVLVIDPDGRVTTANQLACKTLGKAAKDVRGCLGGEAIECCHARKPGGCGGTVHCKTCTIRNTVMKTFDTGKPCVGVKAYPDVEIDSLTKTLCLAISTEKVGDVVLLRIDDLREKGEPEAN